MLGADVVMTKGPRLFDGIANDVLGVLGLGEFLGHLDVGVACQKYFDRFAKGLEVDVEVLEHSRSHAVDLLGQASENMFGPDELVPELLGLLIGQ